MNKLILTAFLLLSSSNVFADFNVDNPALGSAEVLHAINLNIKSVALQIVPCSFCRQPDEKLANVLVTVVYSNKCVAGSNNHVVVMSRSQANNGDVSYKIIGANRPQVCPMNYNPVAVTYSIGQLTLNPNTHVFVNDKPAVLPQ